MKEKNTIFLTIQIARSLEEAFVLAKKEFANKNTTLAQDIIGAKIVLFEIKEIPKLSEERFKENSFNIYKDSKNIENKTEIEEEDKKFEKNLFIKYLINNRDKEILSKNNEIKYIENEIKKYK